MATGRVVMSESRRMNHESSDLSSQAPWICWLILLWTALMMSHFENWCVIGVVSEASK
jgi:hypothetical protein